MAPPGPFGGVLAGLFTLGIGLSFLAAGVVVAVVSVRSGYKGVKVLRSDLTPLSDLRNRRSGPVEVEGTVVAAADLDTVTAPLSGIECYAHTTTREKRELDSSSANNYKVLARGERAVRFAIEDTVGHEVEIDPESASISLESSVTTVDVREELSHEAKQRLLTLPEDETEFSGRLDEDDLGVDALVPPNNMARHRETVLVPGDDIHVYGATTQPAADQRRLAALTGGTFFMITEGDETDRIKKQLVGSAVLGLLAVVALGFGVIATLAGGQFVLGA